jgi:hypothetical protein
MKQVLAAIAFVCLAAGIAGAQADVRARAAQDLVCKAVKIQDWGTKIEARGCGRNAEYERTAGGLELTMLELGMTPAMRRQAMTDLQCTSRDTELTRTFTRELGDQLSGTGCGHEVSYDVEGGALKLKSLVGPAPANVVALVAADLKCPGTIEVTLTKDGSGQTTAGAYDCTPERRFFRYTLDPFQRMSDQESSTAVETKQVVTAKVGASQGDLDEVARVQSLKERAAKDLVCPDAASVVLSLTKTEVKAGTGVDDDLKAMEAQGCGRHAKYERTGPAGLKLTYLEKTVRPEWKAQIAAEMECPADKLELRQYAFPQKGGPENLGATGCDKQGSYQVEAGGAPKLVYQIAKAPPDVAEKIARELGCLPASVKADLIRRNAKDPWSATGQCPHTAKSMFNLTPFRRIGKAPE